MRPISLRTRYRNEGPRAERQEEQGYEGHVVPKPFLNAQVEIPKAQGSEQSQYTAQSVKYGNLNRSGQSSMAPRWLVYLFYAK